MFDVCAIGHVTRDIVRVGGVQKEMTGGTAYYASIALNSLGLKVAVITKTSLADRHPLLSELEKLGIAVFWQESEQTTTFENIYEEGNLDGRIQKVRAIASPFFAADLGDIEAKIFHIGALTNGEISRDFWSELSRRKNLVCLDAQGLVREVTKTGDLRNLDWRDKEKRLGSIDILKVDRKEAKILSGEDDPERAAVALAGFGTREVIVTAGSQGSLIYAKGKFYQIAAVPVQEAIDPTGCGDTYVAGYLYQRLESEDIEQAGKFAAAVAAVKLANFGPLRAFSGVVR